MGNYSRRGILPQSQLKEREMYIDCPKCGEEIDVIITSRGRSGGYFEPPEPAEYDFAEEHPCQSTWTDKEQEIFDNRVWDAMEERYLEPDWI